MFTVVLDACTLVPITLCDTLLRIAETGSFGVRWSATILDEVERTMVGKLGVSAEAAARRARPHIICGRPAKGSACLCFLNSGLPV